MLRRTLRLAVQQTGQAQLADQVGAQQLPGGEQIEARIYVDPAGAAAQPEHRPGSAA
ncbi:MAG: hypothetical protein ACRDSL_04875 [Pseudonocardiaceae bacterium]